MGTLFTAGNIILQFVFGFIIWLLLLRLFIEWFRADFYNPLCQAIYKFFNPITAPLRKVIPGFGGFNFGVLLLIVLVCTIEAVVLLTLGGAALNPILVLRWSLGFLIDQTLTFIFWLVLIRVILSFVSANPNNAMVPVIVRITNPILRPFTRLIPPIGGIDISPMLLMLAIYLTRALVVAPLMGVGI